MKKLCLVLLFCFTFFGCSEKAPHIGKWTGELFIYIEYLFGSNETFSVSSFSANKILVGGGTGTYTIDDDNIILNYEKSYSYNTDTNVGKWKTDNKTIIFTYKIDGENMSLKQEGNILTINLKKVK